MPNGVPDIRSTLLACAIVIQAAAVFAQPGATGPIADLNAEAKATGDTDPNRSIAAALKAQAEAHRTGDVRGEAEALNYLALGHRGQSLLEVAKREAQESERLYRSAGDRWGQAQGYNTLGLIEADAGRFPEALENHLKALAIREKDGDKEGLAYTYNNLGNAYRNMGEFQKALEHHQRGLDLKIQLGLTSSEAFSHHNMGLVHFAKKDYPAALAAYRRGLAIREQLNDQRAVAVSLNAIGQVEAITDPPAALVTYQRTLALRRQTGDRRGEMATALNIADVYRRLGRLDQATATLEAARALNLDAPLMQANAIKGLAEIDAARGNYAAAYRHQLEYQTAYGAIFSQESAERFHHLETAYEAERVEQQMLMLERENALRDAELAGVRNSRTAVAVIAGLVIVSLILLYARYRLKHESEVLKGLLPICAWCKKIREDSGEWRPLEAYIKSRSAADFTHCICPTCAPRLAAEAGKQG